MRRSSRPVSSVWRTNRSAQFMRSSLGSLIKRPNEQVTEALMRKTEALRWMSMDMSSAAKQAM